MVKDNQLQGKKSFSYHTAKICNGSNSQQDGGWFYPGFFLTLDPMDKKPKHGEENIYSVSGIEDDSSPGRNIRILDYK
jgi:hypothetical protein